MATRPTNAVEVEVATQPKAFVPEIAQQSTPNLFKGEIFNNFVEAEHRIQQWGKENYVLFTKSDGRRIRYPALEKDIVYEYITFSCKQGGPPRHTKGKGIRLNQHTLKTNCPAKLRLSHEVIQGEHKLMVKFYEPKHNHELSEELYKSYPENRRALLTPEILGMLSQPQIKNTAIQEVVKNEQGINMLIRDVANLRKRVTVSGDFAVVKQEAEPQMSEEEQEFYHRLIEQVQPRTILYNGDSKTDRNSFELNWITVADNLGVEVSHARAKWNKLKLDYSKCISPSRNVKKPSHFPFMEALEFLRPYVTEEASRKGKRKSQACDNSASFDPADDNEDVSGAKYHRSPVKEVVRQKMPVPSVVREDDSDVSWFKGLLPLIKGLKKKRKRKFIAETTNLLMTLADEEDQEEEEKTNTIYIYNAT